MKKNQDRPDFTGFSSKNPDQSQAILWEKSIKPTVLPKSLIDSYLAASYQVQIDKDDRISLRMGHRSARLATLLQTTGNACAVYITACNPESRITSLAANQAAMAGLYEQLARQSPFIYRGESIDPSGKWPAEESFLALGIDLLVAKSIGSKFGQNAIVWMDSAAIPRLVLLR